MATTVYKWVDVAKVIGIFLMIYGHGSLADMPVRDIIYTFHMPLFFVLSGLLYKPLSPCETLRKDCSKLLVPYLILNAFCLLRVLLLLVFKGEFTWHSLWQHVGAVLMGLGYNTEEWIPVCTPCWFLIALFLCRMMLSFIHNRFNTKAILSLGLLALLADKALIMADFDLLVPLDSALMALPFICAGHLLKSVLLCEEKTKLLADIFIICLLLLLTIGCYYINNRVDMATFSFGNSMFLFYLGGLSGTFFIIKISKLLERSKLIIGGGILRTMATGTLPVIGLNLIVITYVKKIVGIVLPNTPVEGVLGFMVAIVCLLSFYPIILFCKKYFPAVLGFRK